MSQQNFNKKEDSSWINVIKGVKKITPPPGFQNDQNQSTISFVQKFCFGLFGKDKKCEIKNCNYNHNTQEYLAAFNLKECPNNSCGNFCKINSKICSTCVTKWLTEKEQKQKEWEEKQSEYEKMKLERESNKLQNEIKRCEGYKCSEMTKFKYCRQCNEVKKHANPSSQL